MLYNHDTFDFYWVQTTELKAPHGQKQKLYIQTIHALSNNPRAEGIK